MLPDMLGATGHPQQGAWWQLDVQSVAARPVLAPHPERARGAEADRRDERLRPELRLVVRMPAHAVPSISVQIQQNAVESRTVLLGQPAPPVGQQRGPRQRLVRVACVSVASVGIADPAGESWRGQRAAEHADRVIPPWDLLAQLHECHRGFLRIEEIRLQADQTTILVQQTDSAAQWLDDAHTEPRKQQTPDDRSSGACC